MYKSLEDWQQAVRMPTAYRVGNSTLRIQTHFVITVAIVGVSFLVLLYTLLPYTRNSQLVSDVSAHDEHLHFHVTKEHKTEQKCNRWTYNSTYPLTSPVLTEGGLKFRIAVISDLDSDSIDKNEKYSWISYMKKGHLTIDMNSKKVSIEWDSDIVKLKSTLSQAGRGMELSELVVFNGKLMALDDRTGVIFEISDNSAIPWVILTDGNGRTTKGFKSEWACVKDETLYVGGLGKEWTSSKGKLLNFNPQWVKIVTPIGDIEHQDWRNKYLAVRKKAGIEFPGYMIHEAVVWSNVHKQWIFLPRRASKESYNDIEDEKRGTNFIIKADEEFNEISISTIGPLIPTHGFSSFKFVPGSRDQVIVALKTEENSGKVASFITVFTLDGDIWLPETQIGAYKYEGIEFI